MRRLTLTAAAVALFTATADAQVCPTALGRLGVCQLQAPPTPQIGFQTAPAPQIEIQTAPAPQYGFRAAPAPAFNVETFQAGTQRYALDVPVFQTRITASYAPQLQTQFAAPLSVGCGGFNAGVYAAGGFDAGFYNAALMPRRQFFSERRVTRTRTRSTAFGW